MRPLELELVAFRSYDRAVVDWRPHDLVVIAGDTGAGKTSLLDAIAFALFGKTPEHGRPRDLLTLGHTHGEVRLTFALREQVWRVTRRYGKDAPEPALLLERLSGDGGDPEQTLADHVDDRLHALVGLSFEAFTSAVLLAQGRFAQFLGAAPRDRDDILRELFSVASMEGARQAAVRRHAALDGETTGYDTAAAGLPGHAPAARNAAARALRTARARLCAVRGLRPLADRVVALQADAARVEASAEEVLRAVAMLPDAATRDALAARLGAARAEVEAAQAQRAAADRDRDGAGAARELLRARHGASAAELAGLRELAANLVAVQAALPARQAELEADERDLTQRTADLADLVEAGTAATGERDRLAAAHQALRDTAAAADRVADAQASLESATAMRDADIRVHDDALRQRAEAVEAHEAGARLDLAATLRAQLDAGQVCPVCGGEVGDHAPHATGDLRDLRRAMEAAQATERAAGAARARSVAQQERAATDLDAARAVLGTDAVPTPAQLAEAAEAVAAATARVEELRTTHQTRAQALARLTGGLAQRRDQLAQDRAGVEAARARLGVWAAQADPGAALGAALAEVHEAERAADEAAGRSAAAADRAARAQAALHALQAGELGGLRAALARAAAAADLPEPAVDGDPGMVLDACTVLRSRAEGRAAQRAQRAAHLRELAADAGRRLAGDGAPVRVAQPDDLPQALRAAERGVTEAAGALTAVTAAAAEAHRLRDAAADARAEAALHATVARDLQANGFPRFLLGRYRGRLAAGASARLQELTGGAYRFSGREPDPLAVLDLRRGERARAAATLSGGERFLASLALALGLADIAAESGGRLDCLFLDEGFSTLDAESLEQALAGVERLAGDGRLIAVITHLPGVADRLGSTIRVAKDPQGASRVVEPV